MQSGRVKRREFITLIGVAAAWPLAARAQQPAMPVVGFLHGGSPGTRAPLVAAFLKGLNETGYVEGRNVVMKYSWADDQNGRLPALAADLVRAHVAVIAAVGGKPSAFAAKGATLSIPIVFIAGSDPVTAGLVRSMARPGGNITGVNMFTIELQAKRLGLLHELVPAASIIVQFVDPNFPPSDSIASEVEKAAHALGLHVIVLKTSSEHDIDAAFATMVQVQASALLVGAGPFFNSRRNQIVALAARHAIPAVYEFRDSALAGGLMSYGTSLADAYRQSGVYTGRILKGEQPADMPVLQPTQFELVLNLKTAKALGLTIPPGVLAIADDVIE
jgi:putative tryptophan/tyrosine transport system substrate-binding protein